VRPAPPPLPAAKAAPVEEDQISLEDDDAPAPAPTPVAVQPSAPAAPVAGGTTAAGMSMPSKIKLSGGGDKHTYNKFKRNTNVDGTGACRMRTFHGRLSDEGLAFLDDKVNEWLDNHPEVEVKFVSQTVGTFSGKTGESEMFVTIWY
jgi:hypothetical protein